MYYWEKFTQQRCRSYVSMVRSFVSDPKLGAEIGVWWGHTTKELLTTFPSLRMYAVDPWEEGSMPLKSKEAEKAARLEFQKMTAFAAGRITVLQLESAKAAGRVPDNSLDLVNIDGCHEYDWVKQDIELWLPKVRPGGLVSGHDYNPDPNRRRFRGVRQSVDEYVARTGVDLIIGPFHYWYFRKP